MSENKKSSGRKKIEITEEIKKEADEILKLAFRNVGGIRNKLTYNSVVQFNNHIANNEEYIRENGKLFNSYSIRFWSREYDGVPYYGKSIIDALKADDQVETIGEIFEVESKDINSLVDRYHNKPEELKKRLTNLFLKNKQENASLKDRNAKLRKKVDDLKVDIQRLEEGYATLFWNSTSAYNSLNDVLSLKKQEDKKVNKAMLKAFNHNKERLDAFTEKYSSKNSLQPINAITEIKGNDHAQTITENISSLAERLKRKGLSSADEEGL